MAGNERIFQKAMNDGHTAAWDQDWSKAAGYYRQALEQFPENHGALSNLGLALYELKDYQGALKIYQRAAVADPNDPLPVEKLARICENIGRTNEAVRASAQAAELYLKARDPEKAIDNLRKVLDLQPDNMNAYARMAMIFERMGKKNEAVTIYLIIASLLQKSGNTSKATQSVMYALRILPGSAEATQALHNLKANQALAKPERRRTPTAPTRPLEMPQPGAMPEVNLIPSLDPVSEARQRALVQLAEILFEDTEARSPNEAGGRANNNPLIRGTGDLPLDPDDVQRILVQIGQAIEAQTQGDDAQAAVDLDSAVEIGVSHPALHYDLGMMMIGRDDDKALHLLEKAARHPDYALASHLLMGKVNLQREKYGPAAIHFMHALRMADAATVPENQAAQLLQAYGEVVEAQTRQKNEKKLKALCETISTQLMREDWRDLLIKARQQLPVQEGDAPPLPVSEILLESRSYEAIEAIARVKDLAEKGNVRSAVEEAFRALDFSPTYLPLHVQIGELLLKEGLVADATRKFLLAAQLYSLRGQTGQAINLLKRLTKYAPMDMQVRNRLIELLTAQKRDDEALQQYLELADIYYHLGELNNARQAYLSAFKIVQQAQRNRQLAYEILGHLADIDMQRLDWRQALRYYEQMRIFKPDDKNVRQRIVDIHFRLGQDQTAFTELDDYLNRLEKSNRRQDAVSFVYALLADQPEKPELRGRLAEFHLREGKVGMAIDELDQLAGYYEETGNIKYAIRTVEQIIKLEPLNRNEYKEALVRLKSAQQSQPPQITGK